MEENAVSTPSTAPVEAPASAAEPSTSTTVDTSSTSTETTTSSSGGASSSSTEPQVVASASEMSVVVDPITGKRSIQYNTDTSDTPSKEEPPTEPVGSSSEEELRGTDSVDMGQQNLQAPEKYTLDEFSAALANGHVDADRVPQEFQSQYADYRIKEAINQRAAQQQMAYQQEQARRQQIQQQLSPEQRVEANKDFYNALENEATNLALKDLGITQEQLDDAEFADDGEALKRQFENAKNWQKQRLTNEMQARYQQEQNYKRQQQNVYGDIARFVDNERAKEPNFDAIDRMLAKRYQTMPLQQGRVVEQALMALQRGTVSPQQVQVIQNYYNGVRKEYYAEKNGLKSNGTPKPAAKKPPVVETAGSGQQVQSTYRPNYSSLRKANVSQREAWFKEYFKNKGW